MRILELTPARRLEIYKAALQLMYDKTKFGNGYYYGFCYAIDKVRIANWEGQEPEPYFGGLSNYPEIWAYKPLFAEVYWWKCDSDGFAKRINILNEIISKMEAK